MRKRILNRVDVLEEEERSRKLDQQSLAATSLFFCRKIVLAHYVGGLKHDEDPGEAEARALNYESRNDYLEALLNGEKQEINRRFKNAVCRLFWQVDLDFDCSPLNALNNAFVRLV